MSRHDKQKVMEEQRRLLRRQLMRLDHARQDMCTINMTPEEVTMQQAALIQKHTEVWEQLRALN